MPGGAPISTQALRDFDRATYEALLLAQRELELFAANKTAPQARQAGRALDQLRRACGEEINALQSILQRIDVRRQELETAIRAAQEPQPFRPDLVPLAAGPIYGSEEPMGRRRLPTPYRW